MIKDKIIGLDNGRNYYILQTVVYNDKQYALAVECDLQNDDLKQEDYLVMELHMEGNELITKHVEDDEIAKIVIKMLLDKISVANE